jgi:hypothetical protein
MLLGPWMAQNSPIRRTPLIMRTQRIELGLPHCAHLPVQGVVGVMSTVWLLSYTLIITHPRARRQRGCWLRCLHLLHGLRPLLLEDGVDLVELDVVDLTPHLQAGCFLGLACGNPGVHHCS